MARAVRDEDDGGPATERAKRLHQARVTNAVDTLRADGTLDALEKQWLSVLTEGVPTLK